MRKLRFSSRRSTGEMALQITSMADIFTILLVFLLKSYASNATSIAPTAGMQLPSAGASDATIEALKIEVSDGAVSLDGEPVAKLTDFRFEAEDLQGNGSSRTLAAALERTRKRQLLIAKANSEVKVDARILVVADQRTPYLTIKNVLASAAVNGFTDFKLAVVRE